MISEFKFLFEGCYENLLVKFKVKIFLLNERVCYLIEFFV